MKLKLTLISFLLLASCTPEMNKKSGAKVNPTDSTKEVEESEKKSSFSIKGSVSYIFNALIPSVHADDSVSICQSTCEAESNCAFLYKVDKDGEKSVICKANINHLGKYEFKFSNYPTHLNGEIIETIAIKSDGSKRKKINILSKSLSVKEEFLNVESTGLSPQVLENLLIHSMNSVEEQRVDKFSQLEEDQRELLLQTSVEAAKATKLQCIGELEQSCSNGNGVMVRSCQNGSLTKFSSCKILRCDAPLKLLNGKCVELTCSGGFQKSCSIINGNGYRHRECNSGKWSGYSSCVVKSCEFGFKIESGRCVAKTCEGDSHKKCDLPNAISYTSRSCNNGKWTVSSSCKISSCLEGYELSPLRTCERVACPKNQERINDVCKDIKIADPVVEDPIDEGEEKEKEEEEEEEDVVKDVGDFLETCSDLSDLSSCNKPLKWYSLANPVSRDIVELSETRGQEGESCSSWLERNNVSYSDIAINVEYKDGARMQHKARKEKMDAKTEGTFNYKSYEETYSTSLRKSQCIYKITPPGTKIPYCRQGPVKIADSSKNFGEGFTYYPVAKCVSISNWPETKGLEFGSYSLSIKRFSEENEWENLADAAVKYKDKTTEIVGKINQSAFDWQRGLGVDGELGAVTSYHTGAHEHERVVEEKYTASFKKIFPESLRYKDRINKNACPYEFKYTGQDHIFCRAESCTNPSTGGKDWSRPVLSCDATSNHPDLSKGKLFIKVSLHVKRKKDDLIKFRKMNMYSKESLKIDGLNKGNKNESMVSFLTRSKIAFSELGVNRQYRSAAVEQDEFRLKKSSLEMKIKQKRKDSYIPNQCPYAFEKTASDIVMCRYDSCTSPVALESFPIFYPVLNCAAASNWEETKGKLYLDDTLMIK